MWVYFSAIFNESGALILNLGFVPDGFMYPPLSAELSDWLEKADGPVVFISLGTITVTSKEESKLLFEQLTFQDKFYFIWAVKKSALEDLEILEPREFSLSFIEDKKILAFLLPKLLEAASEACF